MTEVKFKRKTNSEIQSLPIDDGSVIFDTTNKEILMDNNSERINFSKQGRGAIENIPVASYFELGGIKVANNRQNNESQKIQADVYLDAQNYARVGIPYVSHSQAGIVNPKAKTNETVEVAVDYNTGKLYVPTYPAGSAQVASMFTTLNFEEIGFDTSTQGIDKGTGQSIIMDYSFKKKIEDNTGIIKLVFPANNFLQLYKIRHQGSRTEWATLELDSVQEEGVWKPALIKYELWCEPNSNRVSWSRNIKKLA